MSSNKKNEFRVSQGNRSTGDYVPQNGKIMWPVKEGVSKEGAMRSKVHSSPWEQNIWGTEPPATPDHIDLNSL